MEIRRIVFMCLCTYVFMSNAAEAYEWKRVGGGIFYTKLGHVHAFQIDLKHNRLSIATAKEFGQPNSTGKELSKKSGALLAINGGFFGSDNKSIGLLMRVGEMLNPIHTTPWWGIFYIADKKPFVIAPSLFQKSLKVEMAVQAGPRLVVDGSMPQLKLSSAKRSGIGIRKDGSVIIVITDGSELLITTFAEIFQKPESEGGLECVNALNLDGGGSSQLYFNGNDFTLDIRGTSLITNAVTVLPR